MFRLFDSYGEMHNGVYVVSEVDLDPTVRLYSVIKYDRFTKNSVNTGLWANLSNIAINGAILYA